ncbi:hypothetical protein BDF19DRAFT_389126 [Syncephalis fuscata]|nr:hypothetical protein BDF19DRAFT_389126 [Syncephalis fuscata]
MNADDSDNGSDNLDEALQDAIESDDGEDSSDAGEDEDVSADEGDSDEDGEEEVSGDDAFAKNTSVVALDPAQQEEINARLQKVKAREVKSLPGVVYVGRIPHGFYEEEMRGYFGQFGTVSRLRLSRNKKTGQSKHYAFIEFIDADVAEVVADTMNNYLLFGHLLKCKVVPQEKIHPRLFDGANRKFKPVPRHKLAREEHNRTRTAEEAQRNATRLLRKENQKRKRIQNAGIEYDFPGFVSSLVFNR